ncbi:GIY-YIG nuclease family protein [Erwinia sorbitola]|uniref:GIY-YIG nuclease family protein n=1 Tax=Erwinia sorbitola TaxID=2681984 RepID=UPI0028686502|nr:GIY-YIG nuclease family protein [Erwinia sorbitola]
MYGLYDPGADKPHYVGITNDLDRRAGEHFKSGRLGGKYNSYDHGRLNNKGDLRATAFEDAYNSRRNGSGKKGGGRC